LEELGAGEKISIEHETSPQVLRWDGVDGDFLWPEIAPEEVAAISKGQ